MSCIYKTDENLNGSNSARVDRNQMELGVLSKSNQRIEI